jgi:hypothetical protein
MGLQHPPSPAVLVLLIVMAVCIAAIFQPVIAMNVDKNPSSPATAGAAFRLPRCLLEAVGVALVSPMLAHLGQGWTGILVASV